MSVWLGGKSSNTWISICNSKNKATAFRQKDGTIKTRLGEKDEKVGDEVSDKTSLKENAFLIFFVVGFIISLFVKEYKLLPLIKSKEITVWWYLIPMVLCVIGVCFTICTIRKYGGKELLKNHGAEHMVICAYEKLRRVPTIEECRRFSRIADACGVTIYSAVITGQLIGFVIYCWTGVAISEIALLVISVVFSGCSPFNLLGMFLQYFTTSEPDDENLELAIVALSALVRMKKEASLKSQ